MKTVGWGIFRIWRIGISLIGFLCVVSGCGDNSTLSADATAFVEQGWQFGGKADETASRRIDFAVFIGGSNPALRDDQPYSQKHFDLVCERYGSFGELGSLGRRG